jgi:anti-sigma B factor antagonist
LRERREPAYFSGAVPPPEQIGPRLRGGVAHLDGTILYALEGDIDLSTADILLERLLGVASTHGGDLIIDMSGVDFMDSNGVRTLLRLRDELSGLSQGVQVKNPSRIVRRVLDVLGAGTMFGVPPPD